jgi:hypothetical protein
LLIFLVLLISTFYNIATTVGFSISCLEIPVSSSYDDADDWVGYGAVLITILTILCECFTTVCYFGCFYIWPLIDLILIATKSFPLPDGCVWG